MHRKDHVTKTHLTADDRTRIETYLNEGYSLRYIAERLDKSPSTISREIKIHAKANKHRSCDCIYFFECKQRHVCGNEACRHECRKCLKARERCKDYVQAKCDHLANSRLNLCNGCKTVYNCHFGKCFYKATTAEREYRDTLINSRNGFDLTYEQFKKIDDIVSPLIKKGQSLYHIIQTNDIGISETTLRRLVNTSELEARNIDLRNTVKRKIRQKRPANSYGTMKIIKDGHKYEDYKTFSSANSFEIPQMDCVEGMKNDKNVLLTLYFPFSHLQLAIILEQHTSRHVVAALDMLEEILGTELFKDMFPAILTDNGHEFADIEGIERSISGGKRTTVFYCEPNHPEQKGGCEKNHELIRYVLPKGTSLDHLTQADVNKVMDNVNSYCRKDLHGRSPYECARVFYPEDFFLLLGLEEVPANDVTLTPALLKRA